MTKHHNHQNNPDSGTGRLIRDAAPDVRGDRGTSAEGGISSEDQGLVSDSGEFQKLLESGFQQTALPQPPALPGWHLCYLTSQSKYDTLQNRSRLGYQPVRRSEMPGFDPSNGTELVGHEGFITCNEMILCKIPEPRYQQLMAYLHHQKPLEEETGIIASAKNVTDKQGKQVVSTEGDGDIDGLADMEASARTQAKRTPMFQS